VPNEAHPGRRDGLESVKKTHQVADVGMGTIGSAITGLAATFAELGLGLSPVDAPPAPLQQ
jgi:hypothetical protein